MFSSCLIPTTKKTSVEDRTDQNYTHHFRPKEFDITEVGKLQYQRLTQIRLSKTERFPLMFRFLFRDW